MKMTDLWTLYEADKRILGFSPHTLKAYSLQFKVLARETGNLNIEEVSLDLLKGYSSKAVGTLEAEQLGPSYSVHTIPVSVCVRRRAYC